MIINTLNIKSLQIIGCLLLSALPSAANEDPYALIPRSTLNPDFTYHPSPADWRNVSLYQVMTDRFDDGDPKNNSANPYARKVDAAASDGIHGGDFAGLQRRIPYLKNLGINGLWLSPIPENTLGDYHGYATQDNKRIDPHWGTAAELNTLIDSLHAEGMVVILDIVLNHMGPVAESADKDWAQFKHPETYTLKWTRPDRRPPAPFNELDMYHAHGAINDWMDPLQAKFGNFHSLNDLKTSSPKVRSALFEVFSNLIAATDCDGFRIDTVKHTEMNLWTEFNRAIRDYARSIGKTNFLLFGENLDWSDTNVAEYTHQGFNSMLYFPIQGASHELFVDNKPVSVLYDRMKGLTKYHVAARQQLVTFLDNHDGISRIAHRLEDNALRTQTALDFLYTWPGIPLLYYGTEQGFNGRHDPHNREDLFDGEYEQGPSLGDNFNTDHPLFRHISQLHTLRASYPALRHGDITLLTPASTRGCLAFTRHTTEEELLIILHWDAKAQHRLTLSQAHWNKGDQWICIDGEQPDLSVSSHTLHIDAAGFQRQIFRRHQ